jgi:hypothetical protein
MGVLDSISFRQRACLVFVLEFYKVIMGTMLVLFVPHSCKGDGVEAICSIPEVVREIVVPEGSAWDLRLAVSMNGLALVSILILYALELRRESWILKHLDVDHTRPTNNLDTEIESFPELKHEMYAINTNYYRASQVAFLVVVANFVTSVLYIYPGYSGGGVSSLFALVNYLILLMTKLDATRTNAMASVRNERSLSAYITVHKTFNVVAAEIVGGHSRRVL